MCYSSSFFFFNDTATTEIYTLSLHDALPIYHHIGDSAGFFQPHQLPGLPCVQRLVNPIANGNVAANERFPGSRPHDVRVTRGNPKRSNRRNRFLVKDGIPMNPTVG